MMYSAQPSAAAAIAAVRRRIAEALGTIAAISDGAGFTYEDDFGARFVDPVALEKAGHDAESLGLLAAAEGIRLAFGDEEGSAFAVEDLTWAETNLRAIGTELDAVGVDRIQLPYNDRTEHIRAAVLREVSRVSGVQISRLEAPRSVLLKDSARLDVQQRAAVEASAAIDLLVNAGAGSGKTHMLSLRIARLVADASISPDRTLALTFSRAAREQIQDRLNGLALTECPPLTRVDVRTIHSLGRRILLLASNAGKTRVRPGFEVVSEGGRRLKRPIRLCTAALHRGVRGTVRRSGRRSK